MNASERKSGRPCLTAVLLCSLAATAEAQLSHSAPTSTIVSISPAAVQAGTGAISLTITGTRFAATTKVRWNLQDRTTNYISPTQVTVNLLATDTLNAGVFPISAKDFSQTPYTFVSNSLPLTVWFADVLPANTHYGAVNATVARGITAGCTDGQHYCPSVSVTRAQMAVFLLKAEHGSVWAPPPATGQIFVDVHVGDFAAAWIEALYNEGITGGCQSSPPAYCPAGTTTRQQMAVFLEKARFKKPTAPSSYSPPAAADIFDDVPDGSTFAPWIEDVYNKGIIPRCGSGSPLTFCPAGTVTRGDMAKFMSVNWAYSLRGTIAGDEPNFHLAGAYLGSVAKVQDAFSVFATAGWDRYIFDQGTGTWVPNPNLNCPYPSNPTQITDQRCGDAHFLIWKHISCVQPPPDPGFIPCATNNRYNLWEAENNHVTNIDPANWPAPGMIRTISAYQLSAQHGGTPPVLPSLPAGNEAQCRPQNPTSRPDGFSAPKVVYLPSAGKYVMAFNGNVHASGPGLSVANDNWRVLWAYSDDGAAWQSPAYLLRNSRESVDCESGFEVQDIDVDSTFVYLLIGAIDQLSGANWARPGLSNRYYLLRAPITTSPPYHGQFTIASGLNTAGTFTWTNVPSSGLLDAEAIGYGLFESQQNYNAAAAFVKVASTPGGPFRWVFVTRMQNDGDLVIWSTPSLTLPPTRAFAASNVTGLSPSQFGWYVTMTKAGKLLPANDADLANPVVFWIDAWTVNGTIQNRLDYRKTRLSLCGLAPYPGC